MVVGNGSQWCCFLSIPPHSIAGRCPYYSSLALLFENPIIFIETETRKRICSVRTHGVFTGTPLNSLWNSCPSPIKLITRDTALYADGKLRPGCSVHSLKSGRYSTIRTLFFPSVNIRILYKALWPKRDHPTHPILQRSKVRERVKEQL